MIVMKAFGVILLLSISVSQGAWFEQKLNHFDSTSGTFRQRYWQTWVQSASQQTRVAFLMISGESADASPLQGVWLEYADKIARTGEGVVCFELEHRYYGYSVPKSSFDLLSSSQALEDIRYFVSEMSSVYGTDLKWVVFGGSYAGSLAAWARQQYPDLIHAAVASSAPVEAKADLDEYLEIVRLSLSSVDVMCPEMVSKLAMQQNLLITDVEYLVQYGFQQNACKLASCFAKTGDYQSCRQQWNRMVVNPALKTLGYNFFQLGFHGTAWEYQQCTEFGWFPTSAKRTSLFGPNFPLSSFVYWICQNDYVTLNRGIARTNSLHHGKNSTTDRIYFVHGSLDPYIVAGVTHSTITPVHVIVGGSHCLDMHPIDYVSQIYQNAALVRKVEYAQELILKQLLEWIE